MLHFVTWDGQLEIVQEQELEFELIQLELRESSHLCIAGVCVKNVAEEFTGDCYSGDYEAVNVVTVDDKIPAGCLCRES